MQSINWGLENKNQKVSYISCFKLSADYKLHYVVLNVSGGKCHMGAIFHFQQYS